MIKNYEVEQFTWALFIGHLTLEKLLKAIYAKLNKENPYPPKIHNLNILAQKCNLELDERKSRILMTCNSFNISARYEDYKNEFYERCTAEYAKGTNNEDSDIDVAIIINSNQNTFDLLVELMMYTQNIDLRIEPHPIKKEDFENRNPFVQEILATGLKVA